MEVKLRRQGCLTAVATVFSLGLYLVMRPISQRHFVRRMDEDGVETRGGKRIAWSEFTEVAHVIGSLRGSRMSEEYFLKWPKGRMSLPFWRMEDPDEALDFMNRHLPANVERTERRVSYRARIRA